MAKPILRVLVAGVLGGLAATAVPPGVASAGSTTFAANSWAECSTARLANSLFVNVFPTNRPRNWYAASCVYWIAPRGLYGSRSVNWSRACAVDMGGFPRGARYTLTLRSADKTYWCKVRW